MNAPSYTINVGMLDVAFYKSIKSLKSNCDCVSDAIMLSAIVTELSGGIEYSSIRALEHTVNMLAEFEQHAVQFDAIHYNSDRILFTADNIVTSIKYEHVPNQEHSFMYYSFNEFTTAQQQSIVYHALNVQVGSYYQTLIALGAHNTTASIGVTHNYERSIALFAASDTSHKQATLEFTAVHNNAVGVTFDSKLEWSKWYTTLVVTDHLTKLELGRTYNTLSLGTHKEDIHFGTRYVTASYTSHKDETEDTSRAISLKYTSHKKEIHRHVSSISLKNTSHVKIDSNMLDRVSFRNTSHIKIDSDMFNRTNPRKISHTELKPEREESKTTIRNTSHIEEHVRHKSVNTVRDTSHTQGCEATFANVNTQLIRVADDFITCDRTHVDWSGCPNPTADRGIQFTADPRWNGLRYIKIIAFNGVRAPWVGISEIALRVNGQIYSLSGATVTETNGTLISPVSTLTNGIIEQTLYTDSAWASGHMVLEFELPELLYPSHVLIAPPASDTGCPAGICIHVKTHASRPWTTLNTERTMRTDSWSLSTYREFSLTPNQTLYSKY